MTNITISPIKLNLAEKLKDKGYRHRFFKARAQDEIASRIRELRKMRELNQVDLAKKCGMKQSAISRIEQASYSRWNFQTLCRLAEALDVRTRVIFEPMENIIKEYERMEENLQETQAAWIVLLSKSIQIPFIQTRKGGFPSPVSLEGGYQNFGFIKQGQLSPRADEQNLTKCFSGQTRSSIIETNIAQGQLT